MTGQAEVRGVAFGVLGPVRAVTDLGPVALKGARQRAVLARLLVARGRVVPVDRLVADLWEQPPDGATAAIRTFVSDLRKALEPDRPPRQPATLLVTTPPGYALHAAPDAVDAWRFEALLGESGRLLAEGDGARALAPVEQALALWRGPAYAEYAGEGWARAEINRLDELRLLAVERRAEAMLATGRAAEAVSDLQAHATGHPLREDAWRLLATALYRAGRQGEALWALRRIRQALTAELGVDPGPRLRQLQADILAQAPHLDPAAAPVPARPPTTSDGPARSRTALATGIRPSTTRHDLFGRGAELARLAGAAETVVRHGAPALALISGDPGAGKTALAEALTRRLAASGWTTVWGRVPEYEGAPVAWPWAQITDALAASAPAIPSADGVSASSGPTGSGTVEDPLVARFRLRRATVSQVAAVAATGPLLLVVDDLHRADEGTLELLAALAVEPEPVTGPVLIVGTYRATEITPELTSALARFARTEPERVYLGGLSERATAELAGAVAGQDLEPSTTHLIHRRSGGNPFFVRELARLLATEGSASPRDVPAGVRDVIRHRLARLPETVQTLLRQAAVVGRDVDPDVLTALAGDASRTLDDLDHALRAGFLNEQDPDGRLRFTHILVRDTLYGDLSAPRRARWHADVAEAIERLHPYDVAALAHHFTHAAGPTTAARAAHYSRAAAEQAERVFNPHEAARLWRQAITAHERAGDTDPRTRLPALMGLGRALAVTGHLDEARRRRAEAIGTAKGLDDPELTADVIAAFDVPAIWTRNDDQQLSDQIVRAAEHTLARLPADRPDQRGRLLSTIALELRGTTTDRGRRAAHEAEAIARETNDPALVALALNARFMHTFHRAGLAAERARVGAELVAVAARHDLVTFEVLGHLVLLQAHCAFADFTRADAHARSATRLAERYDLPLVGVFTHWYAGLRLAADGQPAEAEAAYRTAQARLARSGMPGMEQGLLPLALLCVRLDAPVAAEPEWETWDWGPYEPWVRPLILLAAGRRTEAAAALRALPESPHDLLHEARLCLAARAALALDDRVTMRDVHTRLLPAADELAGAGSGILTLGPVARHLRDLAEALGAAEDAAEDEVDRSVPSGRQRQR